jgi:hypothetical protein
MSDIEGKAARGAVTERGREGISIMKEELKQHSLSPAVAVDVFTPVRNTLSGLPVHVAPLPAGSILVSR